MGEVVQRAWGTYEVLLEADRYKVKRLIMEPGKSFSLQTHHHRIEVWTVVKGTASLSDGKLSGLYYEGQSILIEIDKPHKLTNPGRIPVEIIEVQYGSYLGEDDIVRLDDEFVAGRPV